MITRFQLAAQKKNEGRPPVWFMRQAGRYHSHYQKLKETYSFTELCKLPKVACEATVMCQLVPRAAKAMPEVAAE